jgi:hypothetical protein
MLCWKLSKPPLKLSCKIVAEFQLIFEARGRLVEQRRLPGKQVRSHLAVAATSDWDW